LLFNQVHNACVLPHRPVERVFWVFSNESVSKEDCGCSSHSSDSRPTRSHRRQNAPRQVCIRSIQMHTPVLSGMDGFLFEPQSLCRCCLTIFERWHQGRHAVPDRWATRARKACLAVHPPHRQTCARRAGPVLSVKVSDSPQHTHGFFFHKDTYTHPHPHTHTPLLQSRLSTQAPWGDAESFAVVCADTGRSELPRVCGRPHSCNNCATRDRCCARRAWDTPLSNRHHQ
jgi:hypothetical protein